MFWGIPWWSSGWLCTLTVEGPSLNPGLGTRSHKHHSKKKKKKRKCKPQRLFETCIAYLFNKYLQQASYKTKIWMRPSSCPLRNSLKEERHLKCLRGSNVSFGLQQGQGTGRANFLLIRKFLSKQISDTANGTEITEGANWQEILKNVSSSNKPSLKNGMLSGFGPLII